MTRRATQQPNSQSSEQVAKNNDEIQDQEAEKQKQADDAADAEEQQQAPEFSDEQKAYIQEVAAEAAKAGYKQGRADAAHTEAPVARSGAQVKNSKDVDPKKLEKAVLTELGYICPAPKAKKAA